jgi:hypothetical protein
MERSPELWRRRMADRISSSVSDEINFASLSRGSKNRVNESLPGSATKSFARALESKKIRLRVHLGRG